MFFRPFYYIDYALAQVCAFGFLKAMTEDYEKAWRNYIELCKLGGTQGFVSLLRTVGIDSPFEEGAVKSAVEYAERYLDGFDDMSL